MWVTGRRYAVAGPLTAIFAAGAIACSGCGPPVGPITQSASTAPVGGSALGGTAGPNSTGSASSSQAAPSDPSTSISPASSPLAGQSAPSRPLAGKVVGIDPGHNGGNFADPGYINQLIWNGVEEETCDTTGTQTAAGYTEALFTFNVANYLRADLIKAGARVVMTRHSDHGVGPCVTRRAEIINAARANVAIDIHADGGPTWGRGFTVLEPVADGPNDKVIQPSIRLGSDVRAALLKYTAMPESDYYGHDGLIFRGDLAGLNLTTVPKVLVECGNMPNARDAAMLTSAVFQRRLAAAFTAAIVHFLTRR